MDSLTASLLEQGVPLVGLNVFLQQLGLPIPAVPTMIVAGAMVVMFLGLMTTIALTFIGAAVMVVALYSWLLAPLEPEHH